MKNNNNFNTQFKGILFLILALVSSSEKIFCQSKKELIAEIDTSFLKGRYLLNLAPSISNSLLKYKEKGGVVNAELSATEWKSLYKMLDQTDPKEDKTARQKLKAIAFDRTYDAISESGDIPIGIINADVVGLTKEQLDENKANKLKKKATNDKNYRQMSFVVASLLNTEVFQGNVTFQFDLSLIMSNNNDKIKSLFIDFGDGKGWQSLAVKTQKIPYQFSSAGIKTVKIKLITTKSTYVNESKLTVHFVERPSYKVRKNITYQLSSTKGAKSTAVSGAEIAFYTGCDGVFDKPIIIGEGFDPDNQVNVNTMLSYYRGPFNQFLLNGYDFVFVNYNNATNDIKDNALIFQEAIREVNRLKVGNHKLTIVGESMSGLIARWALKSMENRGESHQVEKFIAFDSPHQGANVPPGLVAINKTLSDNWIEEVISLRKNICPYMGALGSPAAKQMLLFQDFDSNRDAMFDTFRQELDNLGNGGYPSQCRNIALLSGSMEGVNNTMPDETSPITPGNMLLSYRLNITTEVDQWWQVWNVIAGSVCDVSLDTWTNQLNQNTKVYDGDVTGFCGFSYRETYKDLAVNYDRLPEGYMGVANGFIPDVGQVTTSPRFAFVPTFSAIDYKGTLANDSDYTFSVTSLIDSRHNTGADIRGGNVLSTKQHLTPFNGIYGTVFNNKHADPGFITRAIELMGRVEYGLNQTNNCISCSGTGLSSQYYGNSDLQSNPQPQGLEPQIDMNGGAWNPIQILGVANVSLLANNISARWEGYVEAPVTGDYTFNMRTDDGTRVWFNGFKYVDDWNDYPPTDHKFSISLTEGQKYPVKIEWKQVGGGYEAKFKWQFSGSIDEQIVPTCRLFPKTTVCQSPVPYISATPYSITQTGEKSMLIASGCNGTITWWDGSTGSSRTVYQPGTYHATCTESGCSQSSNGFITINNSLYNCSSGNFNGVLDAANCNSISGWVFDWSDYNRTVLVDIIVDGKVVDVINANQNRPDVGDFFGSSALSPHGYTYNVPMNSILKDGNAHVVRVKPCGGTSELAQSGMTVSGCTGGTCSSSSPSILANPTSLGNGGSSTLTASCNGTVTWWDGSTGASKIVYSAGTYSATCTEYGGCTPSGSTSYTINDGQQCLPISWYSNNQISTCAGQVTFNIWVTGTTSSGAEFSTDGINWEAGNQSDGTGFYYTRPEVATTN